MMFAQIAGGTKPGPGGPPNNWLKTLRDNLAVFSIHRSLHERLPTAVLGLNVLWVHAAKKAGKWHRGVLEAAERVMARWHVEEETHISERRAARILAFQRKITGGGVGKARLKKARRRW